MNTPAQQNTSNNLKASGSIRRYLTVKQTAKENEWLTEAALRQLLFEAKSNGLAESGAIKRIGRRILIEQTKFLDWIEKEAK
ncbi:MAG: hypothetical protein IBX56_12155 [Methylomicrobium sp.]|nr:hypothetical protein [Methylomicrobium sp.]